MFKFVNMQGGNLETNDLDEFFETMESTEQNSISELQTKVNGIFIDIDQKDPNDPLLPISTILSLLKTYFAVLKSKCSLIHYEGTVIAYDLRKKESKGVHILIPGLHIEKIIRHTVLAELEKTFPFVDIKAAYTTSPLLGHKKPQATYGYDILNSAFAITLPALSIERLCPLPPVDLKRLSLLHPDNVVIKIENEYIFGNVEEVDTEALNASEKELSTLLDLLPDKYFEDYDLWRNIIFIIRHTQDNPISHTNFDLGNTVDSNNDRDLFYIADEFSKRCPSKYDKLALSRIWNSYEKVSLPMTIKTLHYYAKTENAKEYNKIIAISIKNHISENIAFSSFSNYGIAKTLHQLFNNDFKFIKYGKTKEWYQFVESIGKWKKIGDTCTPLSLFMSEKLKDNVKALLNLEVDKKSDRYRSLTKSMAMLENHTFKTNTLKECETLFNVVDFVADSNEYTIGTLNGVLNLKTFKLEKGYNDYNITKSCSANYYDILPVDIKRRKATLTKILEDIIVEPDARKKILMYHAQALTNTVKSHVFLAKGGGCNGKSTFMDLMGNVFGIGNYANKIHIGLFTDKRESANSANSAFMVFKDLRFAYSSETNPKDVLNTSRMKELTSAEHMSARDLHCKQESFKNFAVVTLCSNHDLIVEGTDHGTWRRIIYYNFKTKFTEYPTQNNEKLKDITVFDMISEQITKDAFLSILVDHYKELQEKYDGNIDKIISPTLENETNDYRNSQDFINNFITKHCKVGNYTQSLDEVINKLKMWVSKYKSDIKMNYDIAKAMLQNSSLLRYISGDNVIGLKCVYLDVEPEIIV